MISFWLSERRCSLNTYNMKWNIISESDEMCSQIKPQKNCAEKKNTEKSFLIECLDDELNERFNENEAH